MIYDTLKKEIKKNNENIALEVNNSCYIPYEFKIFQAGSMKFFEKSTTHKRNKDAKTILFVCVENAERSQMAEGFLKYDTK